MACTSGSFAKMPYSVRSEPLVERAAIALALDASRRVHTLGGATTAWHGRRRSDPSRRSLGRERAPRQRLENYAAPPLSHIRRQHPTRAPVSELDTGELLWA